MASSVVPAGQQARDHPKESAGIAAQAGSTLDIARVAGHEGWRYAPAACSARCTDCPMKQFLLEIFTWWNRQTLGTRFHTWRKGEKVGEDELGNVYYRTAGGAKDPTLGFERRWVIYAGEADASMVPPGWHGWLHHRVDTPPSKEDYVPREWQKPHKGNKTGTADAHRPAGSTLAAGQRPKATGDYQAWTPGN